MRKDSNSGLSPALVELAKKGKLVAGTYRDRDGLVLKVDGPTAARWVLRVTVAGKRRDLGMGALRDVGLADAREKATAKRKEARSGKDPSRVKAMSFRDATKAVYDLRKGDWKAGSKHIGEWWDQMENHILPALGNKNVGDIDPGEMFDALAPIWNDREETARRVRQRCAMVFNWATVKGHRSAQLVNPAEAVLDALPTQTDEVAHHPAVKWQEAPQFLAAVRASKAQEGTRLALEFLILTAARTAEAVYAEWREIDLAGRTWVVPGARMKRRKDHRVALSEQAAAVLEAARARWPNSALVFCGRWPNEALSNQALLMAMRRLGFIDHDGRTAVPHGCRSTFRSWASDHGKDDKACELALSHAVGTKVSRAYDRSDRLDPRRIIMQEWAEFVTGEPAAHSGE